MKAVAGIAVFLMLIGLAACQQANQGGDDTAGSGWTTGQDETAATGSAQTASAGGQQSSATGGWGSAPDFSYRTFAGQSGRLSDHYGKPVVVNFWAAWCPPCKQEMPHFDEIYQGHDGAFELIAVAIDQRNDPAGYFAAQGFSYTGGMDLDGAAKYLGQAIPMTVFIDRRGNLVHKQEGMMTPEQFESHLGKIL